MSINNLSLREVSRGEWNDLWSKVSKSNLTQSWEYGEAKTFKSAWKPSRYSIEDGAKNVIAIFQVLTLSFPALGSIARINRGPLILDKTYSDNTSFNYFDLIKAIKLEAALKKWRVLIFAPEIGSNESIHEMSKLGMRRRKVMPWGSEIISLEDCNEEELLKSVKGKWRNMLRKSQKVGLKVERFLGADFPIFLLKEKYEELQSSKGFKGMPTKLLEQITLTEGPEWKVNVYTTSDVNQIDKNKLSGILVSISHGNTATYLMGYTDHEGRKNNANYLMLWNAILDAKKDNLKYYDLGGLNQNTPEGIARFKKGLNGLSYELAGEFWSIF